MKDKDRTASRKVNLTLIAGGSNHGQQKKRICIQCGGDKADAKSPCGGLVHSVPCFHRRCYDLREAQVHDFLIKVMGLDEPHRLRLAMTAKWLLQLMLLYPENKIKGVSSTEFGFFFDREGDNPVTEEAQGLKCQISAVISAQGGVVAQKRFFERLLAFAEEFLEQISRLIRLSSENERYYIAVGAIDRQIRIVLARRLGEPFPKQLVPAIPDNQLVSPECLSRIDMRIAIN